ncbi:MULTISPECIES: phage tail tape measure protein [Pseudomonas]|uniref:phage tail tape measure protein n=3 Tax=Pseudomonas TaxID=286 RepID=UPI001EF05BAC|nr:MULTISPECIES: phage tail tape measure protein [Pseudomonas]MCF5691159.1 phage tail tape measure protein [Pseudomonas sp. PA-1-8C]MCF5788745.1 phage tail tape measure protein [Pseudomonas sp. PA-1-6G]MCF5791559.1 phage tail tape measure protein [Pseudomonas sp. PA-1-6B]MCF5797670.1 phage tail tape measure protein [Pseudomonas sp. PA-1-5A]MCF8969931.1 phage tail tape measure protein [Pseudomonas carnis]
MNIAELGVKIDSADAIQAKTSLDEMAKAGGRAEQSAVSLMNEMQALEKSLSTSAKTTQDLAKQRDALAKLTKTGAYGEAEAAKISAQLDKQQIALAKSALDEQKALNSLLGAIDPARAALAKLDTQVEQLGKHLDAGRISQDQYNTALSKIDKDYAKLEKTSTGFDKLRLGTRQAQENVVQLGNALSSGDWGSGVRAVAQLGAGAGAGAAGLLAILAPLALATAAVGGLAYAYHKGSEEQDSYNKSLILTGNYAGVSAGQLGDMARQVSATVGTTGQAAAVLAMLADNGKIAGESFTGITQAAVSMQEATGKAVSETVSEFSKLAEDPVKASAALNEQYHYLTASVYSQIVALEKQGDHAAAVKLATDTYADAINDRTPKILANLSLWEKAYNAVARAADGIKNIGRRDINTDIESAKADLLEAQNMDGLFQNKKSKDALIEFRQNRLNMLEDEKAAQADIAKWEGEQAKAQGDAVSSMTKIDALTKSAWTNEQKRTEAVKEYKRQLENIRKVAPNDPRLNQAAIDKNLANINDQFKDPKAPGTQVDLTGFNDAKNNLTSIAADYKNYQKELDAAQKAGLISEADYLLRRQALIGNERDQVTAAYEAEISALEAAKGKKTTSAAQSIQLDQKIADARTGMVKAQKDADSQLEVLATNESGRLAKQERAISTYVQALGQQQRALELAGQRAVLGVGQGDRQNALSGQLNSQQDRFAQQSLELENQRSDPSRNMSEEEFKRKSQALADANKAATDQIRQNYADVENAQGDWTKGATAAWENYLDSARDIAGQTKSLFGSAFSSMEDSIVNFAMTGKASFSDFAKSILADMARIATRQASSALLGSLVGAAASYFGGSAAGGNGLAAGSAGAASSNLGASAGGYSGSYFPQAMGGAWSGGVQMFADGGAFTNSIVSKPTAFGMANGKTGVMGEAGEEAIMPLTRTSSGKLGVMAMGGGGSGSTQINVEVHIDGDGNASSSADAPGYDLFGKELATFIEQKYQELRSKDMRQGGVINKAIKGR